MSPSYLATILLNGNGMAHSNFRNNWVVPIQQYQE
jgi:hypothetical protein